MCILNLQHILVQSNHNLSAQEHVGLVAPVLDSAGQDAIASSTEYSTEERSPIMVQKEHPVLAVSTLIINKQTINHYDLGK